LPTGEVHVGGKTRPEIGRRPGRACARLTLPIARPRAVPPGPAPTRNAVPAAPPAANDDPPMTRRPHPRTGTATVELAVLAPLLVFLVLIAVDFARIFHTAVTVSNCARNGALWESNPTTQIESRYKTLTEAALADATDLNDPDDPPTVSSVSGTDPDGRAYVEVTVSARFQTVARLPWLPNNLAVTRTVRMAKVSPYPR
jgi:TadE-like protein